MAMRLRLLGQAGLRLELGATVVYCDPYLSDSVEKAEGPHAKRLVPIPVRPEAVKDADWVLVSHDHLDHYDPDTLVPLAAASPGARFIVPKHLVQDLVRRGVQPARVHAAAERWFELGPGVRAHPVPACHPTVDRAGGALRHVGYVLEHDGQRAYFAGDTSPHPEIVAAVRALGGARTGFIPINERNTYKERAGILGNMSVREAFAFAQELGVETLVPIHYDMFAANSVHPEEAQLLHDKLRPPFRMQFKPAVVP